LTDKVRFDIVF